MAFRVPVFNVWAKVYHWDNTIPVPAYVSAGYSLCQQRGVDSHTDASALSTNMFQVLFPKGSDVRGPLQSASGIGDRIQIAGYGTQTVRVHSLSDKGTGFTNEYRIANVYWDIGVAADSLNRVNILLAPPPGFLPLPILPVGPVWV